MLQRDKFRRQLGLQAAMVAEMNLRMLVLADGGC